MSKFPESKQPHKHVLKKFRKVLEEPEEFNQWMFDRVLEKAKILSINMSFQDDLNEIRTKWRIEAGIKEKYPHSHPKIVLENYTKHLDPKEQRKMLSDLEDLARKYKLDFSKDFGLISVAVFYGLEPEILLEQWDEIKYTATSIMSLWTTDVIVHPYSDAVKESFYLATISFLLDQLNQNNIEIEIPNTIRDIVNQATTGEYQLEIVNENEEFRPEIFIRVHPSTSRKDIKRFWHRVEFEKAKLWPESGVKSRTWRTFRRDVYIWKKIRLENLTFDDAYDQWLNEHPEEEILDISTIKKGVKKIEDINLI